ncbi:two pore domain potassium channel family protein [Halosimplex rubrum]|uniref:Two pore domain potassium channel family protein n=1 Tax=Halosimplex rubrum TaxID=869889 RepID=A0A7D5NZ19_9EURY|nr:two pore domain potassium channel family protein [Halosimplex rubrum]
MKPAYLLLSLLCLAVVVVDLLWTTLWVEGGAGPVTTRLMNRTWQLFRKVAGDNPRVLSLAGPVVLVVSLTVWIALLWFGWTFLFAGGENTLIDTRDPAPIAWTERFYFVGYSVFTMGNGDFTPRDGLWQVLTGLTTASGMLFVTLSVTYVLNVLGAVTQKRSLASSIHGLGTRSAEILERSWDGDSFRGLDVPLDSIATRLDTLTSNHKAYPALHYFYAPQTAQAPVTNIAIFDEALTLLEFGVAERERPSEIAVGQARSSVQGYLNTLDTAFVEPARQPPPAPPIDSLREREIPTVSDQQFDEALASIADRRRKLLGLVEADERRWPHSNSQ